MVSIDASASPSQSSRVLPALALFFLLKSATAQTYRNISLGSSLSAGGENSYWVSPSGDFAVGFRPLSGAKLFLLAVWFDKVSDKTVVWSANGYEPVGAGSKFELTSQGQLRLSDPQGRELWRRGAINSPASYAALLDSGNLVLVDPQRVNIWESFSEPTDTLLPNQKFFRGSALYSRSATNTSRGRFQLELRQNGDLGLQLFPSQNQVYDALWSSNTGGTGFQLVLPKSGYLYLLQTNGAVLNFGSSSPPPETGEVFQRATLGFDGVFRQFLHRKTPTGSWIPILSIPVDICLSRPLDTGSGVCGFNSYCKLEEDQSPACLCPNRYSFIDPSDSFSGCKPDFALPSCDSEGGRGSQTGFEIEEIADADWPLSDYEHYVSVNERFCGNACLQDCQCGVAIYRGGECWKKRLPLSNGRLSASVGGKALIKVGK